MSQSTDDLISQLETRHQELSRAVERLERRARLTPQEQAEVTALKREKLSAKDRLEAARRS